MTYLQLIVLAIVQAVTAFLPVSSKPHLLLAPAVIGIAGAGPGVSAAIHLGALAAVAAYLWRDSWAMLAGLWRFARTRRGNPGIRLIGLLILGTLPVAVAAYALEEYTDGTALFSALGTSNNVTAVGTNVSNQHMVINQSMTGARTQASVFAAAGNAQDINAQATATANNVSATGVGGEHASCVSAWCTPVRRTPTGTTASVRGPDPS